MPVVVGPTASGKTGLIMRLVERFEGSVPFEVISADAFQVYRGMDVGTAKPSPQDRILVKHNLVDIVDPLETYSAGRFMREAEEAIRKVEKEGRIPLVLGGSGLYLSALIDGLHDAVEADPELRAAGSGREELLERLRAADPEAAGELEDAPRPRILRAVEIVEAAGETLANLRRAPRRAPAFRYRVMRLVVERPELHRRIEERTGAMFQAGLVDEVTRLRGEGVPADAPSQRAIGYREIHRLLDGEIDLAEARRLVERNTRRYAKRQETWFRNRMRIDDELNVSTPGVRASGA